MQKKKIKNKSKKVNNFTKVIRYLIILIIIFNIAPNYEREDSYLEKKINLIINNVNVTEELEYNLYIDNKDVIYLSKEDVKKYFDENVIYDEKNDQIITSYGEKVVELPLEENIIIINNRVVDVLSGAIKKDNIYYIPIMQLKQVYELDTEYIEENKIIILDSLTKKLVKADVSKKCDVKYTTTAFSKTVDKLQRGDKVICIEKLENSWTKIRTKNGKIGYVKTKVLQNIINIRDDFMY